MEMKGQGHRCFRCDDCRAMDRLYRLRDCLDAEIRALVSARQAVVAQLDV